MILTDSYILNYNFNFYSTLLSCLSCHDVTVTDMRYIIWRVQYLLNSFNKLWWEVGGMKTTRRDPNLVTATVE